MNTQRLLYPDISRNATMDVMKAIAAFFVVYIHCGSTNSFWEWIGNMLSRFAVPYFFMVTGYFLPSIFNTDGGGKKYIFKIIKLLFISTLVYWTYFLVQTLLDGSASNFFSAFNKVSFFMWVVHNDVPYGPHLWYFYALLYAIAVLFVFLWLRISPKFMLVVAVMTLCYDVLCEYLGINYIRDYHIGFPCLILGILVHLNKSRLMEYSHLFPVLAVVCILLSVLEGVIWKSYCSQSRTLNFYVLSAPLALIFLLSGLTKGGEGRLYKLLQYIGQYLSTFIFIMHPLVSFVCKELYQFENSLSYSLFIYVMTSVLSYIFFKVKSFYVLQYNSPKNT